MAIRHQYWHTQFGHSSISMDSRDSDNMTYTTANRTCAYNGLTCALVSHVTSDDVPLTSCHFTPAPMVRRRRASDSLHPGRRLHRRRRRCRCRCCCCCCAADDTSLRRPVERSSDRPPTTPTPAPRPRPHDQHTAGCHWPQLLERAEDRARRLVAFGTAVGPRFEGAPWVRCYICNYISLEFDFCHNHQVVKYMLIKRNMPWK